MAIRFNPKGYKQSKKEQTDNNIDNFDQRIEKALDYLSAGFTNERQFISEIKTAHFNYKHNQRNIYKEEE